MYVSYKIKRSSCEFEFGMRVSPVKNVLFKSEAHSKAGIDIAMSDTVIEPMLYYYVYINQSIVMPGCYNNVINHQVKTYEVD